MHLTLTRIAPFAALLVGALCSSAYGQNSTIKGEKVVVFPLHGQLSGANAEAPDKLTDALERVAKKRARSVNRTAASVEDTAMISGCDPQSKDCRAAMLEQLSAQRGITGTVSEGSQPDTLTVTVEQFDRKGKTSRKVFTVSATEPEREFEGALPAAFGEPVPPAFAHVVGGSGSGFSSFSVAGVKRSTLYIMGGGGALMLTGGLFWLAAVSQQGEIDDAPTETIEDLQALAALENSAQSKATIGNVLFVSGTLVLSVGAFLAVRQGMSTESRASAAPTGASKSTRHAAVWAPMPLPDGVGMSFSTSW